MSMGGIVVDSEDAKNVAVVHKTNQGYSGKDLYKLKQDNPELFRGSSAGAGLHAGCGVGGAHVPPPGFQRVANTNDWLYHPERGMYWQRESGKFFLRHAETNDLYAIHQGEDISSTLCVKGDASGRAGSSASSPASRHVVINDLHRAAAAMKLDFSHHDSPAAMFAVYDGQADAGGPAIAEAAAKGLHTRLVPRLAAYRGHWEDEQLQAAMKEGVEALASEINSAEQGVAVAVALLLGRRVVLAASRGAVCMLFGGGDEGLDGGCDDSDVIGTGKEPSTHCVDLAHHEDHVGMLLTVNAVRSAGFTRSRLHALVRPHIRAERPKAACIAVLGEAIKGGAEPPLVAAAVRVAWARGQDSGEAPVKRARVTGPAKVRCRHILLRYVGCQSTGERTVRKKPTRSQADAEVQLLGMFGELGCGGPSVFTTKCRAISECETAMRGGDLSGDLGWLDKDPAKNKKVPATVVRAAFDLQVGQLSDIVTSPHGVHLLVRTA